MENDGGSIRSFGRTRFNSIRKFYTLGCKIGVIMDDLFLFLSLFFSRLQDVFVRTEWNFEVRKTR